MIFLSRSLSLIPLLEMTTCFVSFQVEFKLKYNSERVGCNILRWGAVSFLGRSVSPTPALMLEYHFRLLPGMIDFNQLERMEEKKCRCFGRCLTLYLMVDVSAPIRYVASLVKSLVRRPPIAMIVNVTASYHREILVFIPHLCFSTQPRDAHYHALKMSDVIFILPSKDSS